MTRQDDQSHPAEGARTPGSAEGERDVADQSNGNGRAQQRQPPNHDRPVDVPDAENPEDASKD